MRFPGSFLDEIRARVPLSSVVSRTVRLRKSGREWRGLSPFNKERNPSFFVNDEKRFYHCFSSGRHGDVFGFLMEVEGLSFPEAVERLAGEAGLPLPSATRADDGRAALDAAMEEATAFFQGALEGPDGAAAREYLDGRGIGPEARARFGIGYAPPPRRALRDRLAARGIPAEIALDLGLVVPSGDVAGPYDRFRDRIVFPVSDGRGRTVGFAGRALGPKSSAKYLNTPETALFRKGALLYNQHRARAAARTAGFVVCVEGYTDAIALDGAGLANVVSAMGTALTPEQLDLLWGMAPEAVLCFDGDAAGRRAAGRAARTALPRLGEGRGLRFALLPPGRDPDELARSAGQPGLARVVSGARPALDVLWHAEAEGLPLASPEGRAEMERRLISALSGVADAALRRHLLAEVHARLSGLGPYAPRRASPPPRAPSQGRILAPPVAPRAKGAKPRPARRASAAALPARAPVSEGLLREVREAEAAMAQRPSDKALTRLRALQARMRAEEAGVAG